MNKTNKLSLLSAAVITAMLFTSCTPTLPPPPVTLTVTDTDGNVYNTVKIGEKTWMAENLRTTHYRNGEPVFYPEDQFWEIVTEGAYCVYNNDPNNSAVYGNLYNGYAVADPRNLAPTGWHVATDADWADLLAHAGSNPGNQLKEAGSTHWTTCTNCSPNAGTDTYHFTALPGGYREDYALAQGMHPTAYVGFKDLGTFGLWWTSTIDLSIPGSYNGNIRMMPTFGGGVSFNQFDVSYGMSVRCVKD